MCLYQWSLLSSSRFISALCPRMWWSSSTQAWGIWSTSGRAMRNQSQVNAAFTLTDTDTALVCLLCQINPHQNTKWSRKSFLPASNLMMFVCPPPPPRSDDSCWEGLFWCSLKDRRECDRVSSLQRAWWVSCESRLNLPTVSVISGGSAWYPYCLTECLCGEDLKLKNNNS